MSPSSAQPQGWISPRRSPEKIKRGFSAKLRFGKNKLHRNRHATRGCILIFGNAD
jgi:hypothetical protein